MYICITIALTALYTTLVTGVLQSDIYAASLVDFKLDFQPTAHGVRLQINGYSDSNVLERFMKIIVNGRTTCIAFELLKHIHVPLIIQVAFIRAWYCMILILLK